MTISKETRKQTWMKHSPHRSKRRELDKGKIDPMSNATIARNAGTTSQSAGQKVVEKKAKGHDEEAPAR